MSTYGRKLTIAVSVVILLSAASAQTPSVLTSPVNGATVAPQSIQFNWAAVSGALSYTLWVGTAPNAQNALYFTTAHAANPAGITSTSATLQPSTTYYTTLFTQTAAGSTYSSSSFQTAATAYLTAPAGGATVSPQNIQFTWTAVSGVINYTLWVGTTPGAQDALYYTTANASNPAGVTSTTATLQAAATYYVTLWTLTSAGSTTTTSTFQTAAMSYLTYPANGATGVNPFQPFTWTQTPGAEKYVLLASPTNYLTWDNFTADLAGSVVSEYVWDLQPSTLYYATLCTYTASGSKCSNSTFTTAAANQNPPSRSAFYTTIENLTAQVRLMAPFGGNIATAGTYLYQWMLNHDQDPNGADCVDYAGALADLLAKNGVLARLRQSSLNGVSAHTMVEYWDIFNNKWQIADPTFGVMYFDPNTGIGQGVEDVNALLLSGNLSAITPLWVTNYGSAYMTTFPMDPITYYNNPNPYGFGQSVEILADNVPNSPLPFLTPFSVSAQNPTGVYSILFAHQNDQVTINNAGTSLTVTPVGTPGWATVGLHAGWTIVSSIPDNMQIYAPLWLPFPTPTSAVPTAPALDATVSPQNIQFAWTAVPGAINYTLWIGTTPGAKDAFYFTTANASNPAGITSATATLQAATTYYVTLWTLTSAGNFTTTSTFRTTATSLLTAPANASTVSPQQIQFSWVPVPGAISYTLWIGTTAGTQNALYYTTAHASNPSGITSTVANLQYGITYYATLFTQTSAGSTTSTSTFQTTGGSYLIAPASGASVSPQQVQFSWTPTSGATSYSLWIGTTAGAQDAFSYSSATSTSATAALLPGTTYYATIWTYTTSGSSSSTSTFQTTATSYLINPATGATVPPLTQFSWTTSPGAVNYTLWVGSTPKAQDALYFTTAHSTNPAGITSTSATLQPGKTYYTTLFTQTATGSTYSTSSFQTAATSYLITPASGTTVSPLTQFSWASVPGATDYVLWVGTTPNAQDALYYNAGTGTGTSATLQPATTYYTTLFTFVGPNYTFSRSSFQTAATSYLTSPTAGSTVATQTQFNWTSVPGAVNYTLWVGSTPKAQDALYFTTAHSTNPAGITSASATLQPGKTYYTTLFTQTATGSTYTTSNFQTVATSYLITPAPGATVSPLTQFSWASVPGATDYVLWVGTKVNGQDALYDNAGTATSASATLQPGTTYYTTLFTFIGSNYTISQSSFQTAATSYLTSPTAGSTVATQAQFNWTSVPGAVNYTLWVGSTPKAQDTLYFTTAHSTNPAGITSTSATLQPGKTYYTTLFTQTATGSTYSTSSFQTAATSYLITPASGTTVSPLTQFSWASVPGATDYVLWVGTTPNAQDALYYNAGTGTGTSATLQPVTTYYTILFTFVGSNYTFTQSSFQTSATAVLNTPANGATNLDSGQPIAFSWTAIAGVTSYELKVGTSVGANNAFDSGAITTSSTSATLNPNTTYYARLVTTANGTATHTDTVFSTGYPLAHLTYPLNGATGISQFLPFTWNQVQGAKQYGLTVSPTGYGVWDFYVGIQYMIATDTSQYVWALQPNTTYYVQLCTGNPEGGGCVNSTFTTGSAPPLPPDANAFYQSVQSLTAQVRAMTQGFSDLPTPGSYLYQMMANHGGNPTQNAACGWFAAALLDQFTMNGILARQRNIGLDGTNDGHVLTEYWDPFNQKWELADPTFGAVYFDPNTQVGQGAEDINALLLAGDYSAINPLFVSPYGSQWMTSYYLDPVIMYNEVDPFGMLNATEELNYLPNSPLPFLNPAPLSDVGSANLYAFQFASPTDSITIQNGSGSQEVISPVNDQGWAASVYLGTGWSISGTVPNGMQMFTLKRVKF